MLLLLICCITYVNALPGYRLPEDIVPEKYRLEVITDIEEPNFNFSGNVWIQIKAVKPTNTIILHSKDLDVIDEEVLIKELDDKGEKDGSTITITQQRFVPENEFYIIKVEQNLKPGKFYSVFIPFSGELTQKLLGYYRSKYVDKASNSTKWLGVTQFEATHARKAFPCFDEPAMKAKFTIKLGHKNKFKSISNMPSIRTMPMENKDGWMWNEFAESVPMSTYLVAYLVGDFEYKEAPLKENNVTFRIWSRKEAIDQVEFAKMVGPEVLEYYEQYFGVKYPLPKQDMAAIPDFSAGAMENWGLITYREVDLLYDKKTSSISNKQRVASVIAHELAHQWFGNLVTMKWWTDLWLNEGFATYVATLGVHKAFPDWNHIEEDLIDNTEVVYELDSLKTSHQISKEIGNPDEIHQIFDVISYKKGSKIIQMMHSFLGKCFETGVTDYLKEHAYANAEQDDLWKALTNKGHKDCGFKQDMTVKEIMDTWTLQTGYPIVTVTRDYKSGITHLTQKRYLKIPPEGKEAASEDNKPCWWIPITYTTQTELSFNNTIPKDWLKCGQELQLKDIAKPDEWIILNNNLAGLYRVQYDDKNWRMLTKTLNSDDYKKISRLNRASLLVDLFDYAWRGDVDYNTAFEVLSYLRRETEHIPLYSGLGKLHNIGQMLKRTPAYGHYKKFVRVLIKPMYQKYVNLLEQPEKLEDLRLHLLLNRWACSFDIDTCKKQVNEIFNKWRSMPDPDTNNPIPTNIRPLVYCTVVKYGDSHVWDFLWDRYRNSNHGSEKSHILSSLGCSREVWVIKRYLEWSIDDKSLLRKQDSTAVFGSVAGQCVGHYVACDFLMTRLQDITKYHEGRAATLGRYLSSCSRNMLLKEETEKWKQFISQNKDMLKGAKLAADQSVETVTANAKWYNKHYKTIFKILTKPQ